jgi:hypothetical protein
MRRGPLAVDFLLPTLVQQYLTASVTRGMMEISAFRTPLNREAHVECCNNEDRKCQELSGTAHLLTRSVMKKRMNLKIIDGTLSPL